MAINAMMTGQYKWPPNNLYVYPMKLKDGLEDSLRNGELIGIDLDVWTSIMQELWIHLKWIVYRFASE